ncbi:MAG: pilus assembly protein N-terminal domain-containing protein [Thermoguttaceae bacterium]
MRPLCRLFMALAVLWLLPRPVPADDSPAPLAEPSIVYKLQGGDERLEMVLHGSRILATEQKIAQTAVENPDILETTVLSPTQVCISAKATGVTKVNLWDENKKLYTIRVTVVGDARELAMILRATFPSDPLKVTPVASSVMISGFVEKAEHIDRIIQIAEQLYPKVINNMTVGGVQQVLLHVKVMEVSRTKLRQMGFDWAKITGSNSIVSSASGLILPPTSPALISGLGSPSPAAATTASNPITSTFAFNVANGSSAFFGVLNALQESSLMKIMSEPTLTTNSGQPALFNAGGQIPVPVPQSLGTLSIEWKDYGTQVKFVPIVLGNGKIRLDVEPNVSELDDATGTTISGTRVPGIKSRSVHTTVEMTAGQTLAIAGLVETRIEGSISGLPWISSLPYLGAAFRSVTETKNDVELLILVTPELAEPLDACEVPPCGPGMETTSPSDWELYMKGHIEVPKCPDPSQQGPSGSCGNGSNPGAPPADGMIGPNEQIPAPTPDEPPPHNRFSPPKPNPPPPAVPSASKNGPPGFIGPVGYDVVK